MLFGLSLKADSLKAMEEILCSSSDLRQFMLACENGDIEWVSKALESGKYQVS